MSVCKKIIYKKYYNLIKCAIWKEYVYIHTGYPVINDITLVHK